RAQSSLWELTELRPLERNPVTYLSIAGGALADLVAQDPSLGADHVRALTARLWKLRPLFDDARRNLRNTVSDLSVKKAVELAQAQKEFIAETLPLAVQVNDAKLMDDFRGAAGDASRALDDFIGWLQKDLDPQTHNKYALK